MFKKLNRWGVILCVSVCLILSFALISEADTYINEDWVYSKLIDGQTFVPVRVVSESLNCLVDWDASTNSITISGNNIIVLTVNNKVAFVNNEAVYLYAPPKVYNGKVYVPIRFVSECLNIPVAWDGKNAHIGGNSQILTTNETVNETALTNESMVVDVFHNWMISGLITFYVPSSVKLLDCNIEYSNTTESSGTIYCTISAQNRLGVPIVSYYYLNFKNGSFSGYGDSEYPSSKYNNTNVDLDWINAQLKDYWT